ncbi:MAG: hypothetical protein AAGA54_33235 [Myxococcota bacterium]
MRGALGLAFAVVLAAFALDLSTALQAFDLRYAADALAALTEGLARPDLSTEALRRTGALALDTVAIATVGTALGGVVGLVLAIAAASTTTLAHPSLVLRALGITLRVGMDAVRALPDFAWALAILLVLGPGAITGTLAIAVSVAGILGRAFTRLLDDVPPRAVTVVEASGAAALVQVVYGRLPHIRAAGWSYALARLECSMRNASVIGIVGGGGLGAELFEELGYGRMDRVATLLLALVALTASADAGSTLLRVRALHRRSLVRPATALVLLAGLALLPALRDVALHLRAVDPGFMLQTVARLMQPELSLNTLRSAVAGLAAPLSLAFLSTVLASLVALGGLSWTSRVVRTRDRGPAAAAPLPAFVLAVALRSCALLLRAVPEVAWLLLFAAALRMGTLPALLALCMHGIGVLVRLFTEALDDARMPAPHSGPGFGAAWLAYDALPRLRTTLGTHAALQGESHLRTAFTLGIVGAGGIGDSFHTAVGFWQLERASMLGLTMVAAFIVVDRLARRLAR